MSNWTIKEYGILISLVFSFFSLFLVFYKDYLEGSKLKTILNTITLIRVPEENKQSILLQIILDDLLSGRPSDQALAIIDAKKELINAIKSRNRELTKNLLLSHMMELNHSGAPSLVYDANRESVVRYFGEKDFTFSFYVPLNIINVGRKTGDVSSIFLKVISVNEPSKKWFFSCFNEIKPDEFMKFNATSPTGSIIGRLFPGLSIGPNSNQRLDAFLIPINSANNRIISTSPLTPSTYTVQIVAYNSQNKKCLDSNIGRFTLDQNTLVDLFNGSNIVVNLSMESHVEKEL